MWICLPEGMYMPALRPPHTVPAGDNRLLQIRARRVIDLRRLKDKYLPELGDIIELPFTDYEYRAYCTHEQWARALAQAALDIDYVKFKEQSERRYGDKKLHDVYTQMWSVVFSMLSTAKHRRAYWGSYLDNNNNSKKSGKKNSKKTRHTDTHWSDLTWSAVDESYQDSHPDMISDDEINRIIAGWDTEVPKIARMPNGNIDHSHCDHVNSRNARRRCRQQHKND